MGLYFLPWLILKWWLSVFSSAVENSHKEQYKSFKLDFSCTVTLCWVRVFFSIVSKLHLSQERMGCSSLWWMTFTWCASVLFSLVLWSQSSHPDHHWHSNSLSLYYELLHSDGWDWIDVKMLMTINHIHIFQYHVPLAHAHAIYDWS